MQALLFQEQPPKLTILTNLVEADAGPSIVRKISRIFITASIRGFFGQQIVPFLAGHLTAPAGHTL